MGKRMKNKIEIKKKYCNDKCGKEQVMGGRRKRMIKRKKTNEKEGKKTKMISFSPGMASPKLNR